MFEALGITFAFSVLLSYVNYRWLKLPPTIGVLAGSLVFTTLFTLGEPFYPEQFGFICQLIFQQEVDARFMEAVLGLLVFAGAMHIDIKAIAEEKWHILLVSTLGVAISSTVIGLLIYFAADLLDIHMPFYTCLLFGALISPIEPIAALEAFQQGGAPERMSAKIEGESKFNEGAALLFFSGVLFWKTKMGVGEGEVEVLEEIGVLFMEEIVIGLGIGLVFGLLARFMLRSIREDAQFTTILSLGLALGGIAFCELAEAFTPVALLIAGLIMGPGLHVGDELEATKKEVHRTWMMLDEAVTAFIFVLTGLAIHQLEYTWGNILLAAVAIPIVLAGRFAGVWTALFARRKHNPRLLARTSLLTWSGLRGPASIALALSLTDLKDEHTLLYITCMAVIFSVFVQGLTVEGAVKRLGFGGTENDPAD